MLAGDATRADPLPLAALRSLEKGGLPAGALPSDLVDDAVFYGLLQKQLEATRFVDPVLKIVDDSLEIGGTLVQRR